MKLDLLRDKDGVAHVVGLSGGKDSVCLALALCEREPRPYNYVWTPTGDELPEMIAHMAALETLLGQKIIRLTNGTLASVQRAHNSLVSFRMRFCTQELKLRPWGWMMEDNAPVVSYVGLRADEDQREGTRPGGDSAAIGTDCVRRYPFQEWGWGLDEVFALLEERCVIIPERTDCGRCPYQRLGEWYNLWLNHLEIYLSAEHDEDVYGHTYRSASRDSWPAALRDLRQLFEQGKRPEVSLRMMDKRQGMCRACSM